MGLFIFVNNSSYLSIIMAGGIAVPIDSQLGPEEIINLLLDSETKIVFHSQKTSENVIAASEEYTKEDQKPIFLINFDSPEYKSVLKTEPLETFPDVDSEDIASIIYTSGTTGNPKGVMLTHNNFCSDALALIGAGIVSHKDNMLSILPLHHTYAFMCTFLMPLFLGASITYPASLKGPDLMSAIKSRGVSAFIGVPQLLTLVNNGIMNKIAGLPGPFSFILFKIHILAGFLRARFNINIGRFIFQSAHKALGDRFRFFACGGARLDPVIMKDLEALGFTVLEGYGLTETSPVVTFSPILKRKPGSVGKPLPSVEIKVLNPSEAGEGEIAIKGPMVMKGYYRNPTGTADVIKDGWFMTGDIGRIDEDGYIFITGRSKEVIVLNSGKNIYPEDAEKIYSKSPIIKEICILGSDDNGITGSLHAVIVPDFEYARKTGISNIQEEIKWEVKAISSRIPSYMRITGYSVCKEPLPRTPLGKLRRYIVKDSFVQKYKEEKKGRSVKSSLPADDTAKNVIDTVRQFSKEKHQINADDNLELDIGLDSLRKIEMIVALETMFNLKLPENFMSDIQTVSDLIERIKLQTTKEKSTEKYEKIGWGKILLSEPSDKDLSMISFEKPENRMIFSFIIYTMLRFLVKICFRLEISGIENIPKEKNFIIAPNHTSYLDGFAVVLSLPFTYFKHIYSLGLSKFFTGFLMSWFAKTAHVIPIDSSSYLNKALQMSSYLLRKNRSLMVFPEGARSYDGNLMEFKKGVGILAVEMGVPVVPVYIKGAFDALPHSAKWPQFKKISIIFGKPLFASDIDFSKKIDKIDNYQYFAHALRERVKALQVLR
jgi:long-chain acyl-CoA synthetase